MLTLNYRDTKPIYIQIKSGLKKLMITGAIAADEKLPSVRELAGTLASASGYEVYRSTSKNGKYTLVKTINKRSTVTYVNKKLKSNKTYYYKVRAFKSSKGVKTYGSYSSAKKIKVK